MKPIDYAIKRLREAARDGTMANARFGTFSGKVTLNTDDEVDAFVKKKMDLWFHTWIMGPINEALTILEANKEIVDASANLHDKLWRDSDVANAIKRMDDAFSAGRKYD